MIVDNLVARGSYETANNTSQVTKFGLESILGRNTYA